jgi:ribosomal-protein-alanine N-acetyltransferase
VTKPQPPHRIEAPRVTLRPVGRGDAEAIFVGYSSSEAATRFMNFPRHTTIDEAVAFAGRCVRCWQDGSAFPWAVVSNETAELLGVVEIRVNPPQVDFGYIFCEKYWGLGFASEAIKPVVDWALAQPEIDRVWATCHPENVASERVLVKAGLTREARLENWEARPQLGEVAGPSLMLVRMKSRSMQ